MGAMLVGCLELYYYFFPLYVHLYVSKESLRELFHQYCDIRFYLYYSSHIYAKYDHYDRKKIMTYGMAIVIDCGSISVS